VALEQAKAAMLATAFKAALVTAGLPEERAALVAADFSRRLRVFSDEEAVAESEAISGVVSRPAKGGEMDTGGDLSLLTVPACLGLLAAAFPAGRTEARSSWRVRS
jgi:hypothetical protein